jgi:hypothetical protein
VPVCSKHNGATLAWSLFTLRATFWINPFGLDNPGGFVGGWACLGN